MTTIPLAQKHKYIAFISYSHSDEKTAEWLHRKLESYRLPNAVHRKSDRQVSKHVRPIFRDKTELSTGSLNRILKEELNQSRFLIVMCSPDSAKSKWVNMEVNHFISLNGPEFIIPVIVKGMPHAKDTADECLPHSLICIGEDLLGINFAGQSKEQVLLKTVSALLDIKYDLLYDRHRRRKRRQMILSTAVATVMFSVVLTSAIFSFIQWQQAERRRTEAEQLLNYLLVDIHPKLKQFGRLDILENVAEKSREYIDYISTDIKDPIDAIQAISLRRNMAEVYQSVGKLGVAEALYLKNLAVLEKLARIGPKPEIVFLLQGEAHQSLAGIRKTEGRFQEALKERQAAFSVFKSLVTVKSDPGWRIAKAGSEQRLADAYYDLAMGKLAADHIQSAISDFRRILRENPKGIDSCKLDLAYALVTRSRIETKWGSTTQAYPFFAEAVDLFRQHLEAHPEDRAVRASYANVASDLAAMLKNQGMMEDALVYWDLAIDAERELVAFEPLNVSWRADLSQTIMNKANALERLGRSREGLRLYEEATEHQRKLIALQPRVAEWRATYAFCHHNMAIEYVRLGKKKIALDLWSSAIKTLELLRKEGRSMQEWLVDLANMYEQRGTIAAEVGYFDLATESMKASQAIRESMGTNADQNSGELVKSGLNYGRKALLDYYRKDYKKAIFTITAAEEFMRKAVRLDNTNSEWAEYLAGILKNECVIYRATGFPGKARKAIDECIVILEKLRIRQPGNVKLRVDLSKAYNNLGNIYSDIVMLESSVTAWEKSLELDSDPAQSEYLSSRLGSLAYQYILLHNPGKAEISARKALAADAAPWIRINLAHALLLQGKREAAFAEYTKAIHKGDKSIDSISSDFADFEKYGIHVQGALQMLNDLKSVSTGSTGNKEEVN